MACRLDKVVVRGEISNQVRGRVTGRIWLSGRKDPLKLELHGNCMRDLAGCKLTFENPQPRGEQIVNQLKTEQKGFTGDMTASRKARVPTVTDEELMQLLDAKSSIPFVLANVLYLEWFSPDSGRVVIESSGFKLDISEPAWTMNPAEEETQATESQENFYRFLDELTGVSDESDIDDDEDDAEDFLQNEDDQEDEDEMEGEWETMVEAQPLNEFEWERELREADKRAMAYQEAFDRYKDHPDRERLIAEAMGWEMEEIEDFRDEWEEVADGFQETDPQFLLDQTEEFSEDDEEIHHPLSRRAMRFALRLQEDAERLGMLNSEKLSRESPLISVIVSIIALGGKLAAALDGVTMGYDPEPGFIIAMLKRAQIPLNEALHSLSSIDPRAMNRDVRIWLVTARSELFDLRKDILDVMKEMRQK